MNKFKSKSFNTSQTHGTVFNLGVKFGVGLVLCSSQALFSVVSYATPMETSNITTIQPTVMTVKDFQLPPELQEKKKWLAFKQFWQELNAINPVHPQYQPMAGEELYLIEEVGGGFYEPTLPHYDQRAYYQAIDRDAADALLKKLHALLKPNVQSPEAKMLLRLSELRIQGMSERQRFTPFFKVEAPKKEDVSIMTRMMPRLIFVNNAFSPTSYLVNAIDRIEARLDALNVLKAKGAISDDIYTGAIDALFQDAQLALYLDNLDVEFCDKSLSPAFMQRHLLNELAPTDFSKNANMREIQSWEDALNRYDERLQLRNDAQEEQEKQVGQKILLEAGISDAFQQLAELRAQLHQLKPLLEELER